jgi:four helix bundle protein
LTFLPRGQAAIADQFRRASLSISLNIAEGNGRWHFKERKNFFLIARGSVFECVPLLELCLRQKWITEDNYTEFREALEVMAKMLSALIRGVDEKRDP